MGDAYELEPEIPTPALPGSVVVRPNELELADAMAADFYIHAVNCVRTFGDFHVALPGGRSPQPLYRTLMLDPAYRDMPWKRTHVWIVSDSTHLLPSAAEIVHDFIVVHGDVPRDQFHPMDPSRDDADIAYSARLREHLGWREKGHDRLDYTLLGLGDDGSTAGYAAGEPVPDSDDLLTHFSRSRPARTLSLSLRAINASRFIAILATGADKRSGIEPVTRNAPAGPVGQIRPIGGTLRWYLDEPACSGIRAKP